MLNNINQSNTFKNMTEHFTTNALSGVNNTQKPAIPSIKVSEADHPKKKKKVWSVLTATMGSSILAAGAAVFILNKGFSYTSYNRINKIIDKLNDSIEKTALSKKSRNLVDRAGIFVRKGLRNVLNGIKVSANFNAIKDSSFDAIVGKPKFMRKILDKTTNVFKRISTKAVDQAYNKVLLKINEGLCPEITLFLNKIKANKNIDLERIVTIKEVSKPLKVWLKELETHQANISSNFNEGFSKAARNIRAQEREEALQGLGQKVRNALWKDNGGIFNFKENGEKFKTYITESLSQDGKIRIKDKVVNKRKGLTNNISHNYKSVKSGIAEIRRNLSTADTDSSAVLRKINEKMEAYKTLGGELEDKKRIDLVGEISKLFEELESKVSKSGKYTEETKDFIRKQSSYISNEVLGQSKKGELEEAITIIRGLTKNGIMDRSTEKALIKSSKDITKSLTKATSMETDELYDKFAEFAVGSAPPDVLSLIFPLGVAGAAIASADTKDKKISKTLTTGIPLIGTLVTMLVGTAKMFSGVKNLVFGAVTGLVLNSAGKILDKAYKDYSQNKSFTQLAINAYKNNTIFTQKPEKM